jgi:F-type H+-transporting ATPase subunit c
MISNLALGYFSAGIGAGLCVIGVAMGIGKLTAAAMEATGRQPSAAGDIRTGMLITAAMIEGVAFFGAVVCLILANKS